MTIEWREAPPAALETQLPAPVASGVFWQADEVTFLLELPQVVRFQVSAGIAQYARLGEVEEAAVHMYGAGLPTAAAWVQQGYLALHAAAVATPTGAVVIAGPSAAGKSVLAATLAQHGFPVLADEVTPLNLLDPVPLAVADGADGDLLLWQDAVELLGLDSALCTPLRSGLPRYAVAGLNAPQSAPVVARLRSIYLLGLHNSPDILLTRLEGRSRVLSVITAAFNRYLPQPPALRQ